MNRRILKSILVMASMVVVFFNTSVVVNAEGRTAKNYMEEGIRAAYENMHLIYQGFYDENMELEEQSGGYVGIWQEWNKDWNLISRTYLGANGEPVNRIDGYAIARWKVDENGTQYVEFCDEQGDAVPLDGINLARDVRAGEDGWSEWMTPQYGMENSTFTIGYANLGEKQIGDSYTCSFEIEFRNVAASQGTKDHKFNFRTQGATDGQWVGANVWNGSLMFLNTPIENGIKKFTATVALNETGANTSRFDLGFRCDYWVSGDFRVRNVKVEHGDTATEWTPPL